MFRTLLWSSNFRYTFNRKTKAFISRCFQDTSYAFPREICHTFKMFLHRVSKVYSKLDGVPYRSLISLITLSLSRRSIDNSRYRAFTYRLMFQNDNIHIQLGQYITCDYKTCAFSHIDRNIYIYIYIYIEYLSEFDL